MELSDGKPPPPIVPAPGPTPPDWKSRFGIIINMPAIPAPNAPAACVAPAATAAAGMLEEC